MAFAYSYALLSAIRDKKMILPVQMGGPSQNVMNYRKLDDICPFMDSAIQVMIFMQVKNS